LLQRFATAGGEGFEEGLGVVFDAGAACGECVADGQGEEEAVRVFLTMFMANPF
jgi:hypothetical protein